jgi:MFS family permease
VQRLIFLSHTISLEQLLPILMSKAAYVPGTATLPFEFEGGFGWETQNIGAFLAMQGAMQMVAQLFLFPWLSKKLGSLRTFWITMCLYPVLYILAPYLALLPENLRIPGLVFLLIGKVTFQSLSYPSLAIILANSSPSKRVLGTLNGAAASSASVMRGFGPTISGAVDSFGGHHHMSGLAWWAIACVALMGWLPGLMLKESDKPAISEDDEEALVDCASDAGSVLTLTPDEEAEMVLSK